MSQTTLFLAPPCRSFPCQNYPELDAANAATAAEDIEPMRARVASAFGAPPDEISVTLDDVYGVAGWNFSYDSQGTYFEWFPGWKWLRVQGYDVGMADIFEGKITPVDQEEPLDWSLINRFLFFMGYEVEGITYHERLEWMLQQRELNGEETDG